MRKIILLLSTVILLSFSTNATAQSYLPEKVDAKGHLFIVGGGAQSEQMVQRMLDLQPAAQKHVVVIPFANKDPQKAGETVRKRMMKLGAASCSVILCEENEVDSPRNLKMLKEANVIWFPGGSQAKLMRWMGKSELLKRVKEIYKEGGVVGGTSAGASIMGRLMPTGTEFNAPNPKNKFSRIEKGTVKTVEGFGFLENIIIDQHFLARKRANRLFSQLLSNPTQRGIGIDESTAIIVFPNSSLEVVGKSKILIYEPLNLLNSSEAPAFNIRILSEGDRYQF
ncbi:MAG: cyanophycinase [Bacteroidales bacterium]